MNLFKKEFDEFKYFMYTFYNGCTFKLMSENRYLLVSNSTDFDWLMAIGFFINPFHTNGDEARFCMK